MPGHEGCPRWCTEDVVGPDGLRHQVVLGDVRLIQTDRSTVCQIRRRPRRSPEQQAWLGESMAAVADLLAVESRRRRVVFRDNWAAPAAGVAPIDAAHCAMAY